jgi:hypothetical protein
MIEPVHLSGEKKKVPVKLTTVKIVSYFSAVTWRE